MVFWVSPAFYVDAEDMSVEPHACIVSILLTESMDSTDAHHKTYLFM